MPTYQPKHARIGDIWLDVSIRESHDLEAEVSEHPVEVGSAITDHVRPLPRTIEIEGLVTNHPVEVPQSHAGTARRLRERLAISAPSANPRRIAPMTQEIEGEPGLGGFEVAPGTGQVTALLGVLHLDLRTNRRFAAEVRQYQRDAITQYGADVLRFDDSFDRVTEVHAALVRIVNESQLVRVSTALAVYDNVALTRLQVERSATVGRNALRFTATGRILRFVASESADVPSRVTQNKSRGKQATTPVADPSKLAPAPPDAPRDGFGYEQGGAFGFAKGVYERLRSAMLGGQ